MLINPDFVYSIKEVSDILGINARKLHRVAKKHNLEKIDNRYLFKGTFVLNVFAKEVAKSVEQVSKSVERLDVEIPTETKPNESIKEQFEKYSIEQIEDIDFRFNYSGELSNIGNLVFVAKGKVYAEYTESEYEFAEQKLSEWRFQQKEIEKQAAEITDIKTTSSERVEHYKNLFEYQRKQSDRILQIHEKLVGSLNELTKANVQRNIIEAKDKDVINDDWKTQ
jgi:hypothetical protein